MSMLVAFFVVVFKCLVKVLMACVGIESYLHEESSSSSSTRWKCAPFWNSV